MGQKLTVLFSNVQPNTNFRSNLRMQQLPQVTCGSSGFHIAMGKQEWSLVCSLSMFRRKKKKHDESFDITKDHFFPIIHLPDAFTQSLKLSSRGLRAWVVLFFWSTVIWCYVSDKNFHTLELNCSCKTGSWCVVFVLSGLTQRHCLPSFRAKSHQLLSVHSLWPTWEGRKDCLEKTRCMKATFIKLYNCAYNAS